MPACSSLIKTYKTHAKRLVQTGGGIGAEEDEEDEDDGAEGLGEGTVFMEWYIPPSGPDAQTPAQAVNLWGTWSSS